MRLRLTQPLILLCFALVTIFASCDRATNGAPSGTATPSSKNMPTPAPSAAVAPGQAAEVVTPRPAQPATLADEWRGKLALSGPGWKLWRDKEAPWRDDELFLPSVSLARIPTNPPTGGWAKLDEMAKMNGALGAVPLDVKVPGTVEEYLWGVDGDPHWTKGVYQGVSFWWRDFTVPTEWKTKRCVLQFDATRQRAEVYVNEQLVGYDIVANTPFEADVTKALRWDGKPNRLVVRITNHSGPPTKDNVWGVHPNDDPDPAVRNVFDWADYEVQHWGSHTIPSSHGFGGITGDVNLIATDSVEVHDVYVANKPSPSASQPTDVDVSVEVMNHGGADVTGTVTYRVYPHTVAPGERKQAMFTQKVENVSLAKGLTKLKQTISMPGAKLWDTTNPNLYECEVAVETASQGRDAAKSTFGFRWFGVDDVGGNDAVLRLNGKRIVLLGAITWNYYPVSGMVPTEELTERQIKNAKALGLNMLYMHRNIGPRMLMERCAEEGLLTYCEPGGYKCENGDTDSYAMAREKLMRMVRRDRSNPSVTAWCMINEIWVHQRVVKPHYLTDMRKAHLLDPSRAIILASGQAQWNNQRQSTDTKSWMMPYDNQIRETGWYDEHKATGPGSYNDGLYRGPENFYSKDGIASSSDIIFWGEDGAISSPPQLDSLKADYEKNWKMKGWDGDDNLEWQKSFADWLDAHKARKAFPTVNDLCRGCGDVAYYYQGRTIESMRMYNPNDAYVINAWDCQKIDNSSGIVGPDRRLKGNPELIARYAKSPLYVAVRLRRMLCEPGASTTADFWIINEKDVKGSCILAVTAKGPDGKELMKQEYPVNVSGGERYGELLRSDVSFDVGATAGYATVTAELKRDGKTVATGDDKLLIVDYKSAKLPEGGIVVDRRGAIQEFLDEFKYTPQTLDEATKPAPFIVTTRGPVMTTQPDKILDRVKNDGTTLIVLQNADGWAKLLNDKKIIKYEGKMEFRGGWLGGGFFVTDHPILDGLPKSQGCNWEYQLIQTTHVAHNSSNRSALWMTGDEAVIGAFSHHEPKLGTGLGVVPYGKGKIILSTIDLVYQLTSGEPAAVVPKKIMTNMLVYSGKK